MRRGRESVCWYQGVCSVLLVRTPRPAPTLCPPQVGATKDPSSLLRSHGHPDPDLQQVEGVATAAVDLDTLQADRAEWGLFRDRRPDLYGALMTKGGAQP